MSDFSPTEAALEGLRVSRERPGAVLWWWGAHALANLLEIGLSSLAPFRRLEDMAPAIQTASDAVRANPGDTGAAQRFMVLVVQAAPTFAAFAAISLLVYMVLSTAVLRSVIRPAERRFGALRLSGDELRQLGLALLMCAAFVAYAFVVSLASGLLIAVIGGVFGALAPPALLGLVAFVAIALAFLYPAVRLSLAPAMTFADRKISFLRVWALTKGRFWSLFGAYLIAFAIAGALWLAISTLFVLLLLAVGLPVKAPVIHGLADMLAPGPVLTLVVNSLLTALLGAIVTAPMASAYLQIAGAGPRAPAAAGPGPAETTNSPWG